MAAVAVHLGQGRAAGRDQPREGALDVVAVQRDVVQPEVREARRRPLLPADLEHLEPRTLADDDHPLPVDRRPGGQPELTLDLLALARLVLGSETVVGDLRAEPVDEERGGGVEVGDRDADVLDAAGQGADGGSGGLGHGDVLSRVGLGGCGANVLAWSAMLRCPRSDPTATAACQTRRMAALDAFPNHVFDALGTEPLVLEERIGGSVMVVEKHPENGPITLITAGASRIPTDSGERVELAVEVLDGQQGAARASSTAGSSWSRRGSSNPPRTTRTSHAAWSRICARQRLL